MPAAIANSSAPCFRRWNSDSRLRRRDLTYLANLCHNCGECLYACQYAPPHEFGINVPRTLAQIRVFSYEEYCWPRFLGAAFRHQGLLTSVVLSLVLSAILLAGTLMAGVNPMAAPEVRGDFYTVISHETMMVLFSSRVHLRRRRDRRGVVPLLARTCASAAGRRRRASHSCARPATCSRCVTCTRAGSTARRRRRRVTVATLVSSLHVLRVPAVFRFHIGRSVLPQRVRVGSALWLFERARRAWHGGWRGTADRTGRAAGDEDAGETLSSAIRRSRGWTWRSFSCCF